jgi:hypothetical protein
MTGRRRRAVDLKGGDRLGCSRVATATATATAHFRLIVSVTGCAGRREPVKPATVGNKVFVSVESILSTDQSPYEVMWKTEL